MRPESRAALETVQEIGLHLRRRAAAVRDADGFAADLDLRAIVERHFITIGEALARVARHDPTLFARIPAGREIVDFRNVLVHGYDAIDLGVVWDALTQELGELIATIARLLDEAGPER